MKLSSSLRILIGLALGLLFGIIFSLLEKDSISSFPDFIAPIGTLWVNAIRMVVIPLLMALLVTSIAGQTSGAKVAQLGGKTIGLFMLIILFSSLFAFVTVPPLLALLTIDPQSSASLLESTGYDANAANELPPFSEWFVSLIPDNPFAAAAESAVLPLLIFTGLFAIAILRIEEKQRNVIVEIFNAIKSAMFVIITWIMLLAPIGIFALVFTLTASLGVSAITVLGSFIVMVCGLLAAMTLILYPLVASVAGIPMAEFARTIAPVQVIGFSTRSSLASMPATMQLPLL